MALASPLDMRLLVNLRKKAEDLQKRLYDLSHMHAHFSVPNEWPVIVDKFFVLARTQYQTLQEELGQLITKEYLLKPISLVNLKDEQALPELLRTKVEPEVEKEQKILVQEYYDTENLDYDHDENIERLKVTIDSYNRMIDELQVHFEDLVAEIIGKGEKDLLSPRVVMADVTDKLVEYYYAVTIGRGLTVDDAPETEPSLMVQEEVPQAPKKILTDAEKQKQLLDQAKMRKQERKEKEEALMKQRFERQAGQMPVTVSSLTPATTSLPVPLPGTLPAPNLSAMTGTIPGTISNIGNIPVSGNIGNMSGMTAGIAVPPNITGPGMHGGMQIPGQMGKAGTGGTVGVIPSLTMQSGSKAATGAPSTTPILPAVPGIPPSFASNMNTLSSAGRMHNMPQYPFGPGIPSAVSQPLSHGFPPSLPGHARPMLNLPGPLSAGHQQIIDLTALSTRADRPPVPLSASGRPATWPYPSNADPGQTQMMPHSLNLAGAPSTTMGATAPGMGPTQVQYGRPQMGGNPKSNNSGKR